MEGKIVYQGVSKDGTEVIIRYPEAIDAEAMTYYINTLSDERTFIRFQGEHLTLQKELDFLASMLKRIEDKNAVMLLVYAGKKLIGISNIELGDKIERHIGTFGISISKEFRGKGIGKLLMELTEKEAISNLTNLEIIRLGVFANNPLAIEMYKKAGFIEEGRLPNGIKLENGYQDHIYMYKPVN